MFIIVPLTALVTAAFTGFDNALKSGILPSTISVAGAIPAAAPAVKAPLRMSPPAMPVVTPPKIAFPSMDDAT